MAWVKLDDQFADHPKILAVGPPAAWLYVCGLTYCARLLTDGLIPLGQVRKLADLDRALDLAQDLVRVGLWEECAGGYLVHDYLEYNPSRERTLATREARAEAGRVGGKQKASKMLAAGYAGATHNDQAKSYPVPVPVPVPQPDPVPAPHEGAGVRPLPPPDGGDARDGAAGGGTASAGSRVRPAPKPTTLTAEQNARFRRWYFGEGVADYAGYPHKAKRPDAERAFAKLDPDDALVARLIADIGARLRGRQWADGAIEHPATYLNQRIWEDDIQPIHAGRGQPRGGEQAGDRDAAVRAEIARRAGQSPPPGFIEVTFREGSRDAD